MVVSVFILLAALLAKVQPDWHPIPEGEPEDEPQNSGSQNSGPQNSGSQADDGDSVPDGGTDWHPIPGQGRGPEKPGTGQG
jgi:hypothetical protein